MRKTDLAGAVALILAIVAGVAYVVTFQTKLEILERDVERLKGEKKEIDGRRNDELKAIGNAAKNFQPIGVITTERTICTNGNYKEPCEPMVSASETPTTVKIRFDDLPPLKKLLGVWWEPHGDTNNVAKFNSIHVELLPKDTIQSKDTIQLTVSGLNTPTQTEASIRIVAIYGPE